MKKAAAILIFVLAAGCRGDAQGRADDTVSPVSEPMVTNTAPVVAETESGATLVVILEDNTIGMPTDGIVPGPAVFTIRNGGQQRHSFAVEGPGVTARLADSLAHGEEATMEVTFQAGSYRAWCPVHENVAGEAVQFQVTAR
ncbi:MAG TPA: hypothetical protein VGF40_05890 [Thermoanaerobaculia bacterium]